MIKLLLALLLAVGLTGCRTMTPEEHEAWLEDYRRYRQIAPCRALKNHGKRESCKVVMRMQ